MFQGVDLWLSKVSDAVRRQAWKTIGIAFGVGFLLGAIAASR